MNKWAGHFVMGVVIFSVVFFPLIVLKHLKSPHLGEPVIMITGVPQREECCDSTGWCGAGKCRVDAVGHNPLHERDVQGHQDETPQHPCQAVYDAPDGSLSLCYGQAGVTTSYNRR